LSRFPFKAFIALSASESDGILTNPNFFDRPECPSLTMFAEGTFPELGKSVIESSSVTLQAILATQILA